MSSLNGQGKHNGILLFAFNSQRVNYLQIAKNSCKLIRKQTQLPITIVTDINAVIHDVNVITVEKKEFNNSRVDNRTGENINWKNMDRFSAYELSPYDRTLLLDSDYLMFNNNLLKYFDLEHDYLLFKNHSYLDTGYKNKMGPHSLPYVWATAVLFRKTNRAKQFFNLVKMIQENYSYYVKLYSIYHVQYRNDFAFTIANYMMNGYNIGDNYFTETLYSFEKPITSIKKQGTEIVVRNQEKSYVMHNTDLHIHDKRFLENPQLSEFIND